MDKLIDLKILAYEYERSYRFSELIEILYYEWQKNKTEEGLTMLLLGECFYVPYFTVFTTDDYGMTKDANLDIERVYEIMQEVYLSWEHTQKSDSKFRWYVSLLIDIQPIIFETAISNFPKDEDVSLAKCAYIADPTSQIALSRWKCYGTHDNLLINRDQMIQELQFLHLQKNMVDQNLAWYFAHYDSLEIPMEEITV